MKMNDRPYTSSTHQDDLVSQNRKEKKNSRKRKLLAVLLAMVMLMGVANLGPMNVAASDTDPDTLDADSGRQLAAGEPGILESLGDLGNSEDTGELGKKLDNQDLNSCPRQIQTIDTRIEVIKTFEDWELFEGDVFRFDLYVGTIDGAGDITYGNEPYSSISLSEDNPIGYFELEGLTVGTHTFRVEELNGGLGGVVYDLDPRYVTVEVTEENGVLLATVAPNSLTFINVYDPLRIDATIQVNKELIGRELTGEDEFKFLLYKGTWDRGGIVEYEDDPRAEISIRGDNPTGIFILEGLIADNHLYKIVEVKGSDPSIKYDSESKEFIVFVEGFFTNDGCDESIELVATVDPPAVTFTNRYRAKPVTATISGRKYLANRELEGDDFTFGLFPADQDGNIIGPPIKETTNDADGNWSFNLKYRQGREGSYYYVVKEAEGALSYIGYDASSILYQVEVEDNLKGNMVAYVSLTSSDEVAAFHNQYRASGSYSLNVKKEMVGRALVEGEFDFQLLDGDGKLLQEAKNKSDGLVAFSPLSFDQDDIGKTYSYKVRERAGSRTDIAYDDTEYSFTLKIEDKGGGLLAIIYDSKASELKFTNIQELVGGDEDTKTPVTGEKLSIYRYLGLVLLLLAASTVVLVRRFSKKEDAAE